MELGRTSHGRTGRCERAHADKQLITFPCTMSVLRHDGYGPSFGIRGGIEG